MSRRRPVIAILAILALLTGIWLLTHGEAPDGAAPAPASHPPSTLSTIRPESPLPKKEKEKPSEVKASSPELAEIEKNKEIDREHLRKLRDGIFAYKAKYGNYPEYLSQLAPEFVPADVLRSPRGKNDFSESILGSDHPDPGMEKPAYGYEFSNLEFRDGRTFAEIKEVQRTEWGDAIPLLRVFGYDKVMNMSWGGEIYETQLNWEWDAATLDVVDKLGWGPGLESGNMVKVQVRNADGMPVSGAKVWADGRNYSFDLPDRPFTTDAEGYARIPIGVDNDRTALALRLEAPGYTAPVAQFAAGETPAETTITAESRTQTVGGTLVDESGAPLANTRLLLRQESGSGGNATLAQVRTDEAGHWQAAIHPDDAAAFTATVGIPGGAPIKYFPGVKVDSAAAAAGNAKVTVAAPGQ
ncbi:MAG: hypothetical protein JWM59_3701 [Verrucomicrobiales bacterium]|nr:hypothetical protein [Verrucomicrobiales bacterium]